MHAQLGRQGAVADPMPLTGPGGARMAQEMRPIETCHWFRSESNFLMGAQLREEISNHAELGSVEIPSQCRKQVRERVF